jgi:hypothetical protein
VPLLLFSRASVSRLGRRVDFIDNHKVGAVLEEERPAMLALGKVNADNLIRVITVDGKIFSRNSPLKLGNGACTDDDGWNVELGLELPLPLLAQMGRAQDAKASSFASVQKLVGNHGRFNRLTYTNVVRDQQSDWLNAQGHDEWHELVRPWANRNSAK